MSARIITIFIACGVLLGGCPAPEGGCKASITGSDNTVTQACGGAGESSPATVTTPAPVVVPPVVITPVITGEATE